MDMGAESGSVVMTAALVVKVIVDVLRMGVTLQPWAPPTIALLGGVLVCVLLLVSAGHPLTMATVATAILNGILAGGSAVGVTELAKRANAK